MGTELQRDPMLSHKRGDSTQRVVQPTVTEDGEKAPSLKFNRGLWHCCWR